MLRSKELGYNALALTDHNNLCGAMRLSLRARSMGVKVIIGAEVTLRGGYHMTFLAENKEGYRNLSQLITSAHNSGERSKPELPPGIIPGRNCILMELARQTGANVAFTGNVHYHVRERHQLQDCLVAIKNNQSLEESHRERRPNSEFYMRSIKDIEDVSGDYPDSISNTVKIAERCNFDLARDQSYTFPVYNAPEGYTPETHLEKLCNEAAVRRYGAVTPQVKHRLDEEFKLIRKFNLAGFLLLYNDVINILVVNRLTSLVSYGLNLSFRSCLMEWANTPHRAIETEQSLKGSKLDDTNISRAAGLAAYGSIPLEKNFYKVTLIKGILAEALSTFKNENKKWLVF